jgi:tetratricopeptide (TPR) repeat protein
MFKLLKKNMTWILGSLVFFFIITIPVLYGGRSLLGLKEQNRNEVILDKESLVASVNGVGIPREKFYNAVENLLSSMNSGQPYSARWRIANFVQPTAFEQLVGYTIVINEAKKNKLKITNKEVHKEIEKIMQELGKQKDLRKILKERGLSFDSFKNDVLDSLLYKKMIEEVKNKVSVTDQEVKEKHKNKPPQDLKKAKEDLLRSKQDDEYYKWFSVLRAAAKIEIFDSLLLAFQQEREGKLNEALLSFQQAMSTNPANPYFNHYIAQLYERLGKLADAEAEYKKAVVKAELNPSFADTIFYISLADYYRKGKNNNLAAINYKKASVLAGDDISVHTQLKNSFSQLGFIKDANVEQKKIDEINKKKKKAEEEAKKKAKEAEAKKEQVKNSKGKGQK